MKYSVEQDLEDDLWYVYDKDTGKKVGEGFDSRRAATREMGRLDREGPDKSKSDDEEGDKKKKADEEHDEEHDH